MELKIKETTFPEVIEFNFSEIKKEVAERVKHYSALVYTEDQVKIAKADRAQLRKFVEALESKRKEIKKQCLAPYEAFERQLKEIVAIVNEPIALIDGQCKEFEDKRKEEKREAILAYWYAVLEENKIPAGITLEQMFDEKWLNASAKISTVCKEFNAKLERIEKDLATLAEMPDISFEAKEIYLSTLDLNKAIAEGKRLVEMQKRKAEEQAKMTAELEKVKTAAEAAANGIARVVEAMNEATTEKGWVSFQALLSVEDAAELKAFFNSRGIEYKAIGKGEEQ